MILDLQHISETPIHNFKGGDGMVYTRMYSDDLNRIMLARITPGSSIGMHTHETNSEIVYVLSGTARIMMDDGEEIVQNSKAWKESYGEMCKKTVLRRLCKLIDLNFDTAEQCQAFEDGSSFDVKEKPKEKYQAQDIYQSQDQRSHNGDEDSDGE